jgi:hypothetical protein
VWSLAGIRIPGLSALCVSSVGNQYAGKAKLVVLVAMKKMGVDMPMEKSCSYGGGVVAEPSSTTMET